MTERVVYTPEEAAEILGVNVKQLLDAAGRGDVPHMRLGRGTVRFLKTVIHELKDSGGIKVNPDADPLGRLTDQVNEWMTRLRACEGSWPRQPEWMRPYGFVYAIEGCGLTKIGRAEVPLSRLLELQRSSPARLTLVALAHGCKYETNAHQRYASRRLHGEWFAIDENPLPFDVECATCRGLLGWA